MLHLQLTVKNLSLSINFESGDNFAIQTGELFPKKTTYTHQG